MIVNHQNNFGTNLTAGVSAGDTTSPLNSIPTIDAPYYLAFDATNLNSHYEVVYVTSDTATNVNHAALAYAHTTSEEVRMVIPASEMNNLGTLSEQTDGAWVSWTPTLVNITLGNGTQVAKYTQIGKTIHAYYKLTLGSTSAIAASPSISLPVEANNATAEICEIGSGQLLDTSESFLIQSVIRLLSSTAFRPRKLTVLGSLISSASISNTSPFTWATGDSIEAYMTYEAA